MKRVHILIVLLLSLQLLAAQAEPGPRHTYLTWQQTDTSTTMTVVFQTMTPMKDPTVYYGQESCSDLSSYPTKQAGRPTRFPGLERWVHFVELTGLEPGQTYYFRAGASTVGFGPEHKFRTMADKWEPVRFVAGGDMWIEPATHQLLIQAASQSPQFALVGGDMAYADGRLSHVNFWDKWFDAWEKMMVTPSGHMVPMILAVGNHETVGGFGKQPKDAPFYYNFFRQDEYAYFSRQLGPDIIVYVLDSGHTTPQDGAQAAWLAREMKRTAEVPNRFALYHVPCYPSYPGAYNGPYESGGRKHWVPLFDRYKLTAAFENHYHTFKRTHPLRGGKVTPEGTIYLGDGCWGRPPRKVKPKLDWYEAVTASRRHIWLVDVNQDSVLYRAMDPHGKIFDSTTTKR